MGALTRGHFHTTGIRLCRPALTESAEKRHQFYCVYELRMQEGYVNEQKLKVANNESYIENWVHEIKKPLSLMTLLLDNRKLEMSPLVHTRMLYVRDHVRQNVEQIQAARVINQIRLDDT